MKVSAVVFLCAIAAVSCDEECYHSLMETVAKLDSLFSSEESKRFHAAGELLLHWGCSAYFGHAEAYLTKLNNYAGLYTQRSFQYLLMSSYLGNHRHSREGFQHLYRKLSDEAWEDAIEIMKYITMRGGEVDLRKLQSHPTNTKVPLHSVQSSELESLARAVDIQKELAEIAHRIYKEVNPEDPEMGSYVEDKFMHKQAMEVRMLVGLTNDLMHLLEGLDGSRSIGLQNHVIDQYIEKYL